MLTVLPMFDSSSKAGKREAEENHHRYHPGTLQVGKPFYYQFKYPVGWLDLHNRLKRVGLEGDEKGEPGGKRSRREAMIFLLRPLSYDHAFSQVKGEPDQQGWEAGCPPQLAQVLPVATNFAFESIIQRHHQPDQWITSSTAPWISSRSCWAWRAWPRSRPPAVGTSGGEARTRWKFWGEFWFKHWSRIISEPSLGMAHMGGCVFFGERVIIIRYKEDLKNIKFPLRSQPKTAERGRLTR